ncbi:hypothetical protein MTR_2g094870 [Medicago truncatula]|uniref:Uncharacterized protein n=1 Tax=Medicago truncatula TaxID=3880 RepID=A0A072VCP8_MEDTR|nr:hypothetical protein MTR_2g094870 [Medicago truncatula]
MIIDPRRRGVDCARYAAMESVHVLLFSYSSIPLHFQLMFPQLMPNGCISTYINEPATCKRELDLIIPFP